MAFMHYGIILLLILHIGCRENNVEQQMAEITVEIPEDFPDFYEKFHQDSAFQMNHIVFPLATKNDTGKWLASEWVIHKPFDDMGGDFRREFDNLNGIIIEKMTDRSSTVTIERRFSKMDGQYRLIYYKISSRFGN